MNLKSNLGLHFILILLISFAGLNKAYCQEDVIGHVRTALKTGSSKELVKYVNTTVEINIDGEISTYSRMQAEFVFKDFFKLHPPTNFQFNHQGASKGGLIYAIGKYAYKNGKFMVWLRIKEFSGEFLIYEMNFIKE